MKTKLQKPTKELGLKTTIIRGTILICAFLFIFFPFSAFAHPGRTAADGCHYCRTNCDKWGVPWNVRHCHGGATIPTPTPSSQAVTPQFSEEGKAFVVNRIVDGDTIEIKYNNELKKVRLTGIDTPETVDPRKSVQCFGAEATVKLKSLIDGKSIKIEKDSVGDTIDTYGRLLRYVYLDNENINAEMVKEGYAYAYLNYSFSKSTEFKNYETDAKNRQLGLWSPEACVPETNTIKSIKNEVKNSEPDYNKNHHWFRENLIDKLVEKFKIDKSRVTFYVYTMLPDKK